MTVTDLLTELSQNGVHLAADGERLVVNAPKGVLSDEHRALLAAHKPELLLLLRDRPAHASPDARAIVPDPAARYEPFPLTDIQQAYWIGRAPTMDLGGVGCHAYRELESADVDVARLEDAWNRLVERHDMLRAVFLENGTQRILPRTARAVIAVTDLREAGDDDAQRELARIRESMSHRLFDPTEWPLFDLRATRLPNGRTRIHISLDLLIADAASMLLLFREWQSFYDEPAFDPDPPALSFRDYVLDAERRKLHDGYRDAERYWRERLDGFPPPPKLPLAKSPATIARPRFTRRGSRLEAAEWSRFKRRAAEAGLTPSAAVCAAYADVLALWSNSRRFAITLTLFRGGTQPQLASIIGDFTSTILLEADATAPTFELRAQRLQSRLGDDLEHSAVSGVQVLRELNRVRRETDVTVVPVVFTSALGHRGVERRAAPPLAWLGDTEFAITQTPQVWIDHHVYEEDGALIFSWDALDELFAPGMLDGMFDAYAAFLRALAAGDAAWQQRIGALLPEAQRSRRAAANATDGPLPDELLHAPFVRQAMERPAARAVVAPDRALTYGELEMLSRSWAAQLRARGVAPGRLVAVIMEKGWEQVVAVLAILRAGAVYLPIDPALPPRRIEELLRDGEVALALTRRRLELPADVAQLLIDAAIPPDADPVEDTASPDDLAYVIYTSGSTGMPKGVMIDHRAASNTIADINERFAVSAADRVLALSALNFDLSVYDIFGTLAAGGTIVIPPPDAARNPQVWWELIERERVTIWNSVPALMEMLAEWRGSAPLDSLRLVMLSGDWIPLTLPPRVQTVAPRASIVSLGGATEASIWSIAHPIDSVRTEWSSIPYGRPLRNQRFHVLGNDFDDLPDLVTGRLFIGGAGLARGYWHDEAKTNAKFFTNPRTGERIYDTGDLGRWMPDGNIEFLGREDQQVKIQGHRIELGEIEAALLTHPRVRAAAVHTTGEREKRRLVAYAVLDDDSAQRLEFKLAHHGLRTFADSEHVALPAAEAHPLLASRRTRRRFHSAPVDAASFAGLLGALMERTVSGDALPKRLYPSAGDTYPIQVYAHVKAGRVDGLDAGTYYYDPAAHRLVLIARGAALDRELHAANNRTAFDEAAFSIFLVAEMNAIAPLYGPLARDFALLEVGYIGQLLMTSAAQAGLALCPIGTMEAAPLAAILRLGESHELLHSFVGGPPADATQQRPLTIVEELRAHLRARLPESMVPADVVVLSELPLSANGKVDRSRLPAPRADRAHAAAAPSGETARALARMAAEILGIDAVAPDDNFFDAGANSLHMVQLHRRISEELHAELPLVDLFRHPTVNFLAERLGENGERSLADEGRRRAEARLAAKQRRTT